MHIPRNLLWQRAAHALHRYRNLVPAALRALKDTVSPPDAWDLPGKQETCVEWLRELHGTRDWCVKAAQ